jgi:hypothetical protein
VVSGYQEAAEAIWMRNGTVIHAIFRDTVLKALEGWLARSLRSDRPLVRTSLPQGDDARCARPTNLADDHIRPRG